MVLVVKVFAFVILNERELAARVAQSAKNLKNVQKVQMLKQCTFGQKSKTAEFKHVKFLILF